MSATKWEPVGDPRTRAEYLRDKVAPHQERSGQIVPESDFASSREVLDKPDRCPVPVPAHLPAEAVAAVLRQVLAGEASLSLLEDWDFESDYSGVPIFAIGTPDGRWLLSIFNDCAEVDYIEVAVAPDGRAGDFQAWHGKEPQEGCPLDLLTEAERDRFEETVFALKPAGRPKCERCGELAGLTLRGLSWSCSKAHAAEDLRRDDQVDAVAGEPWPNPARDPMIDEWNRVHGGPTEGEAWHVFVAKWSADYRTAHAEEIARIDAHLAAGGQLVPRERRVVGWEPAAPRGDFSAAVLAERQADGTIALGRVFPALTPALTRDYVADLMRQRQSIDRMVEAIRALPDVAGAWAADQLSDRTARLYRRVYGKRPPGSNRTARLRKKRLSRMPTRYFLIAILGQQAMIEEYKAASSDGPLVAPKPAGSPVAGSPPEGLKNTAKGRP